MKYNPGVLWLAAFMEGAAVMAAELLAARMLAPYYGASLYAWASVIGITLFSLTLGYYAGGYLSDRYGRRDQLASIMLFAAGWMMLMPALAKHLTFEPEAVSYPAAMLMLSAVLLMPPLTAFGMVTPYIIRMLSHTPEEAGKNSGRVYAVSTAGGIVSTFLTGFWVIPAFGLTVPAAAAGALTGLAPLYLLGFKKRPLVIFITAGLLSLFLSREEKGAGKARILHSSEGLLGQVLVADVPRYGAHGRPAGYDRMLFVNRMGQTWVNRETGRPAWSYVDYVVSTASVMPPRSEVLLLGLGGGTVARYLSHYLQHRVDAVELDPRIGRVAGRYFGLDNSVRVHIDDARHYIRTTRKKYDLVVMDIYKGEVIPHHVLSLECFREVRSLLKDSGFVIVSFNGFVSGKNGRAGRALYRTLREAGYTVWVIPTPEPERYRNCLYVAGLDSSRFSSCSVKLTIGGKTADIRTLILPEDSLTLHAAQALTDDRPVLEMLNLAAAESWRRDYNRNFTGRLRKEGVPLFR